MTDLSQGFQEAKAQGQVAARPPFISPTVTNGELEGKSLQTRAYFSTANLKFYI